MNLYLLRQPEECIDYDTYDSMIVCAVSEDEARRISPCGGEFYEWNGKNWEFLYADGRRRVEKRDDWPNDLNKIKCKLIGKANNEVEKGIVLASFNAG